MRISLRHPEREKDTLLPHRKYPAAGSSSSMVFFRRELETFSPVLYDALGGRGLRYSAKRPKYTSPLRPRNGMAKEVFLGGRFGCTALPHEKWADEAEKVPIIKARRWGK